MQSSLEVLKQKEAFEHAESRRLEETKITNELKQRCANLEHKVQELERRNARLDRRAGEMEMNYKKMSQTAESYRLHYEGLKGKALTPARMDGAMVPVGAGSSLDMRGAPQGLMMAPPPRGPDSRSSSASRDSVRTAAFSSRLGGSDRSSPSPSRGFLRQHRPGLRLNGSINNAMPSPNALPPGNMGRALFANGRSMSSGFMRHGPSVM